MNAVPSNFWQWISSAPPETLVTLVFAGLMAIVVILFFICLTVKTIYKYRLEIALKRELVERGLSVDEIERIVAAKGSVTSKDGGD